MGTNPVAWGLSTVAVAVLAGTPAMAEPAQDIYIPDTTPAYLLPQQTTPFPKVSIPGTVEVTPDAIQNLKNSIEFLNLKAKESQLLLEIETNKQKILLPQRQQEIAQCNKAYAILLQKHQQELNLWIQNGGQIDTATGVVGAAGTGLVSQKTRDSSWSGLWTGLTSLGISAIGQSFKGKPPQPPINTCPQSSLPNISNPNSLPNISEPSTLPNLSTAAAIFVLDSAKTL
jgi:hypothetical protein